MEFDAVVIALFYKTGEIRYSYRRAFREKAHDYRAHCGLKYRYGLAHGRSLKLKSRSIIGA